MCISLCSASSLYVWPVSVHVSSNQYHSSLTLHLQHSSSNCWLKKHLESSFSWSNWSSSPFPNVLCGNLQLRGSNIWAPRKLSVGVWNRSTPSLDRATRPWHSHPYLQTHCRHECGSPALTCHSFNFRNDKRWWNKQHQHQHRWRTGSWAWSTVVWKSVCPLPKLNSYQKSLK